MDTTLKLPAALQGAVDESIARAVGERWASRIWASDTSLWTADPEVAEKIAHRLGWLFAPTYFEDEVAELTAFGERIAASGYTDVLICGMGGSSLAPEVLSRVDPDSEKGLRVHVLDSTDPAAVAAYEDGLESARTLRIIATKSGTTIETQAFLAYWWAHEEARVGRWPHSKAGNEFGAITDKGDALKALSLSNYCRETFLNPTDVGGRYSALTYVGLVPAALLWLDLDPLLEDCLLYTSPSPRDKF